MKAVILVIFCAAFCEISNGKRSSSRASHFAHRQDRHYYDVCDWECTNETSAEAGIATNWELDVVTSVNESLVFSIGYDATIREIAVIHRTLDIAVSLDGKTGLVGWFNITAGSCLVINVKDGLAVYVTSRNVSDLLRGSTKIDVQAAIAVFAEIISSNAQLVKQGVNSTIGEVFNCSSIVNAIYIDYNVVITADGYFNGRDQLQRQIQSNFGTWLQIVRNQIADGDINVSFGIIGFSAPVLDRPNALTVGLLRLLVALYGSTSGEFSGQFALTLYRILSVNIFSENTAYVFSSLTSTIKAVGSFFPNLDAALSSYAGGKGLISFAKKTVVIASVTYVIAYGKSIDGSWFINLKSQSDDSVDVIVGYVKSSNAFAIYNRKLNIILVFSGSLGLFALWNTKTGEGIIISYASGAAIVISADSAISESFSAGAVFHGLISISAKIETYKSFRYSLLDTSTFLFSTYIATLQTSGLTGANLGVTSTVRAVITESFQPLFQQVVDSVSHFVSPYGVLNIIYVISGGVPGGWSTQILEFIARIYLGQSAGKFGNQNFLEFYNRVLASAGSENSTSSLPEVSSTDRNVIGAGNVSSSTTRPHRPSHLNFTGGVFPPFPPFGGYSFSPITGNTSHFPSNASWFPQIPIPIFPNISNLLNISKIPSLPNFPNLTGGGLPSIPPFSNGFNVSGNLPPPFSGGFNASIGGGGSIKFG